MRDVKRKLGTVEGTEGREKERKEDLTLVEHKGEEIKGGEHIEK